jgi:hypothetical protein
MLFPMLNVRYYYISTFRSTCAVPGTAVFRSFISCFPVMLLRHFLSDFKMIPVVSIIPGITTVFTFHMCCISIVRFLEYSRLLSLSYFCLLKLQYLLTYMFIFHYHGLQCLVYRYGWFCQFALVHP